CVFHCNFFFSSRRRHTRSKRDWSSDVCSSDLKSKTKEHISTIQLLQDQIAQLQAENQTLKEQLKIKDKQIETANKLTDQAQQLNVLDKKELDSPVKKHWWQK